MVEQHLRNRTTTAGAIGRRRFAMVGAACGAIAWGLILALETLGLPLHLEVWDVVQLQPLSLLPGLVFGLGVGWLLRRRGGRLAGYAAAATAGHFCAYHVAYHLFMAADGPEALRLALAGLAAGAVGAAVLGAATQPPLRRLPVVVGGAAGVLLALVLLPGEPGPGWLAFFVLWQAAYAAALAEPAAPARRAP